MWYDEAVVYQIYPLGLCGAPLQNDGDPVSYTHLISTRKIMAVSLVVIFVLVVLLLWSLIGGSKADSTPVSTPQPTAAGTAGETTAETVPNLVGLRYTTDIKGNSAYDDLSLIHI